MAKMDTPIQVVGIGRDGAAGLSATARSVVERAALLVGSDRHLRYFPNHPAPRISLADFQQAFEQMQAFLDARADDANLRNPRNPIVVLVSGDPLFFGFGRLLLHQFGAERLTFHPHLSSVQLAFSRIKRPWQDAQIVSLHGRSPDPLIQRLQQGCDTIAVLTDPVYTPGAIAQLVLSLDLPHTYAGWVCENLGGEDERVQRHELRELVPQTCAPLNVLVLCRQPSAAPSMVPLLGIPDAAFASFGDRPGLMTKREIRTLILAELGLQPRQVVWDIGAGTGSVSIEIARLCPDSQIFAIEKTAAGVALIQENGDRFQTPQITAISGSAPAALAELPDPDRVFIGGSGGHLAAILDCVAKRLQPGGVVVLAIATLEHLSQVNQWVQQQGGWRSRILQAQLARSVAIAHLTRFQPLNPVYLVRLETAQS